MTAPTVQDRKIALLPQINRPRSRVIGVLWLLVGLLVVALFLTLQSRSAIIRDRDAMRAAVNALHNSEGDGSCAVMRDGSRVICALRAGRLQYTALHDVDIICTQTARNRAICTLSDGRKVSLRMR